VARFLSTYPPLFRWLPVDVLVAWPHVCKNKAYKPEYDRIQWEDNHEHFQAWCEGRTGVPIVDAAMRQLNTVGWMHNRCRMITASFLAKHLLIYWRLGEKDFMQHLIDGDFEQRMMAMECRQWKRRKSMVQNIQSLDSEREG
jgi:deoxyribodipyrimidine photolyase